MNLHYEDARVKLWHGDCIEVLRSLPDASVDSVVCDPPYGLGFMGKEWDAIKQAESRPPSADETDARFNNAYPRTGKGPSAVAFDGAAFQAWCEAWAAECLRVLKPGGHMLAFGGTRTWHRLACAVENVGFEVRDSIAWLYGSGFPKSLDVSKAIDKARDDRDDVLALTSALADLADAASITRADLDAAMGTSDMGGWWLSRLRHRCACPSVDNWTRLRDIIPGAPALDDLVWRLNGRKGSPGEAWGMREVIGERVVPIGHAFAGSTYGGDSSGREVDVTAPATDAAREWAGWGTALKPAFEPVVVARKPLVGTVAANVTTHGTGALNIDGTRIGVAEGDDIFAKNPSTQGGFGHADATVYGGSGGAPTYDPTKGRWPANVILDEDMADVLDEQSGIQRDGVATNRNRDASELCSDAGWGFRKQQEDVGYGGQGGASRFFYVAKAPKRERPVVDGVAHPTVKPLALMRWLVRLVTPPGGTVLEPFAGSGTTVEACLVEGFQCIAIEKGDEYLPLILARINRQANPLPEAAELVRQPDVARAIAEQVAGQLDIFGEETA